MKGFLFSFFVLFLVVSPAQAADDSAKQKPSSASKSQEAIKESAHMPPWPYTMPMQKEEREARIDFFLNHMSFQLKAADSKVDASSCKNVFTRLKENREVKVLGAEHYLAWRVEPLKLCPALAPDKEEIKLQIYPDKPDDLMPVLREATANHEFYDLSAYLGEGVWGYLGEGVTKSCPDGRKNCVGYIAKTTGYSRFSGMLGAIFSTKTCQKRSFPELMSFGRISFVYGSPYDWYAETPDFTAYAEVSGKLYLVAFHVSERWQNFSKLNKSRGRLLLIPVGGVSNRSAKSDACVFVADSSRKE